MPIPARIWLCSNAADVASAEKLSAVGDFMYDQSANVLYVAGQNAATSIGVISTGAHVAALTDSTGGTASTTLAAIAAGTTYAQGDMVAAKNALASIAAQFDALRTSLVNAGFITGP